jgi:hypothetical protein
MRRYAVVGRETKSSHGVIVTTLGSRKAARRAAILRLRGRYLGESTATVYALDGIPERSSVREVARYILTSRGTTQPGNPYGVYYIDASLLPAA